MEDAMTYEDDAARLGELGRELPSVDLDAASAERIAHRARGNVGRGPSLVRFVEPAIATVFAVSYLAWAIAKVLEALR
jgi:hypothetical protein